MLKRKIIQSQPIAWSANGAPVVNMQFLDSGYEVGPNPRITRMWIEARLNVTTAALNNFQAVNWGEFISNMTVGDSGGDRLNGSGALLRDLGHLEFGDAFIHGPYVPAGTGPVDIAFVIPLPIFPKYLAAKESDFSIPLDELRDGARCSLLFGGAVLGPVGSQLTINAGGSNSLTLYADIRAQNGPAGVVELPPRLVCLEYNATLTDDFYTVGGVPRFIGAYAGNTAVRAATPFPSQRLESQTLSLNSTPNDVLQRVASFEMDGAFAPVYAPDNTGSISATAAAVSDPVRGGRLLPIFYSRTGQSISDLPEIPGSCQYKTTAATVAPGAGADAKMFISVIRGRCGNSATAAGYSSQGLSETIGSRGAVVTPNGYAVSVSKLPRRLVKYLPVIVPAGKPVRDGNC